MTEPTMKAPSASQELPALGDIGSGFLVVRLRYSPKRSTSLLCGVSRYVSIGSSGLARREEHDLHVKLCRGAIDNSALVS